MRAGQLSGRTAVRLGRAAEFLAVFIGLPLAFVTGLLRIQPVAAAVLVGLICTVLLLRDRSFDRRVLWNAADLKPRLRAVASLFAVGAVLLAAAVALAIPERLFALPRSRPSLWALVMVAYPLLSVYPQEVIYRAFFFHRYRPLFGEGREMIAASAAAFGFMHILFGNWIAVVLTMIGGVLFALRYQKTGSLLVTAVEHAVYGQWIFTVGLGEYFWSGTQALLDSSW